MSTFKIRAIAILDAILTRLGFRGMLTQAEADQFIQMVKHFIRPPASITIPLGADDTYELASLE